MIKKIVTLLFCYFVTLSPVYAQTCDASCGNAIECRDKIAKCQEAWDQMEAAKKPHVEALSKMEKDIAAFQNRLKSIEADVVKKAKAIAEGEKELVNLLSIVGAKVRAFYRQTAYASPMATFFAAEDLGEVMRILGYQRVAIEEEKKSIARTAISVRDLEKRKSNLEEEKSSLAYLKVETDKRAASVRKLVGEASAYQTKLTGFIGSLTTQQQNLLSGRSGTFTTSVGDVPLADDPNAAPNYNPGFSPAYGGFSFGAYTHRKGMSQYGAKGRADRGQNYQDILKAYYSGKSPAGKDTGGTISVSGFGNLNFEDYYLLGIAEMPSNFPKEALKAQAVAARSYAYRYKVQGQSICVTQACQVFSKSKADNPPGEWRAAVNETRGQVLEDIVTYYSSTTGGYSTTSGWDTICGNQGCWTGDAYEKIAGSPWFYKGWYTAEYFNNSGKCGRSHPWLNGEEFADILNAWTVRKNGNSEDAARILPVSINSCPVNGVTGNPYSMGELRERAGGLGGAYTSVSSVSVSYNSGGYTDTVTMQTNRGEVKISGSEFKETFNLRAPGYISIRSQLYNIEKK